MLVVLAVGLPCGASSASTAAPANDNFENAQQLSGALPIELLASNVGATHQVGDPDHSPQPSGGHSIWFRWEATNTEAVTISTCGSAMPTILAVYLGSALGGLSEVAGTTWEAGGCLFQEGTQATFRAIAGKIYSIEIDGNTNHESSQPPVSGEGAVALRIRHRLPPANDDFAAATTLEPGLSARAPNFGATKEAGEPNHHGDPGGASVWFKFTAPKTQGALVQLNGGSIRSHHELAVYTGSSVAGLTPVAGSAPWEESELIPVVGGRTYWIAVDGTYDPVTETPDMDEPEISLSFGPGNDDFKDAYPVSHANTLSWTFVDSGLDNVGATKQAGEPDHAGNRGGASVWFQWTAPESGSMQVSACSTDFPTILGVYTGSSLGTLTPVASTSRPCGVAEGAPGVNGFNVDSGKTYWIAVDGVDGAWGTFGLVMHTSKERLEGPAPAMGKPPQTKISGRRVNPRARTAQFHLAANELGSHFLCRLDSRPFKRCGGTVTYRKLAPGRHTFRSKAVNTAGEPDPTPIVAHFTIPRLRP